jgi:hypothetical protein
LINVSVIPLIFIMNIIFYIILGYLLYKFIFSFLVPVIRTSLQVRKSFRDMRRHMNGQPGTGNAPADNHKSAPAPKKEDYIDFEEIKD